MISVLLPTHNPRPELLARTLAALRAQTLPFAEWELVVIDNASTPPLTPDLGWHPAARVVVEPRLGLTAARVAGFKTGRGEILVLVDDDNVLRPDYLATAWQLAKEHPQLGAWSGGIRLEFQPGAVPPPSAWRGFLAERVVTAPAVSTEIGRLDATPWGAGLCLVRAVATAYLEKIHQDPRRLRLDLQGGQLIYGGDTDIADVGCELGLAKGVFPQLQLDHLILASRCTREYLVRAAEGHGYSEVLHCWLRDGRCPSARPAWRQWLERLRLPREERAVAQARARGFARACREFGPNSR